jgi:transcriptional regulator with PAS, ATPase and Fis domain
MERKELCLSLVANNDPMAWDGNNTCFQGMVGLDIGMQRVFTFIETVCDSAETVLVQGESGTGKELVAQAIHRCGARRKKPFVVVNCAAIPESLMESELFGHRRGAFTGASVMSRGKLEAAEGGTVFFDDIDSLSPAMQAKLLRTIQEKEFQRLGSARVIQADIRFIAASNRNLEHLMAAGQFRSDLYFRLNVLPIRLPPLRERKGDIDPLFVHFFGRLGRKNGCVPKRLSAEALKQLTDYAWPGNVRELENLAIRLATTVEGDDIIRAEDIPPSFRRFCPGVQGGTLKEAVRLFEKQYIETRLEMTNGNRRKAAELLGVHRNTLLTKLNHFRQSGL